MCAGVVHLATPHGHLQTTKRHGGNGGYGTPSKIESAPAGRGSWLWGQGVLDQGFRVLGFGLWGFGALD